MLTTQKTNFKKTIIIVKEYRCEKCGYIWCKNIESPAETYCPVCFGKRIHYRIYNEFFPSKINRVR